MVDALTTTTPQGVSHVSRSLGANKEIEQLARRARKQGWTVEITKKNHLKFTPPNGGRPIFGGLTTCSTGVKKFSSSLRKAGLE